MLRWLRVGRLGWTWTCGTSESSVQPRTAEQTHCQNQAEAQVWTIASCVKMGHVKTEKHLQVLITAGGVLGNCSGLSRQDTRIFWAFLKSVYQMICHCLCTIYCTTAKSVHLHECLCRIRLTLVETTCCQQVKKMDCFYTESQYQGLCLDHIRSFEWLLLGTNFVECSPPLWLITSSWQSVDTYRKEAAMFCNCINKNWVESDYSDKGKYFEVAA